MSGFWKRGLQEEINTVSHNVLNEYRHLKISAPHRHQRLDLFIDAIEPRASAETPNDFPLSDVVSCDYTTTTGL